MVSAQEKLLYVGQKLGLSTLKYMQGSTRCVYDSMPAAASSFQFFKNVSQRSFPETNVDTNQFEANEALLIQSICLFQTASDGRIQDAIFDSFPQKYLIRWELVIGNKVVMKDMCQFDGVDYAFKVGSQNSTNAGWIDLEAVGIVIPPLVDYQFNVSVYDLNADPTGNTLADQQMACYLYGTGVLLNLNTSL